MTNPNNCETCDHKKHPDGRHCYMFRYTPTEPCAQHTFRLESMRAMRMQFGRRVLAEVLARHPSTGDQTP